MRIIAGRWRGRRFQSPAGETTRPTADRVREALFSILAERVLDTEVLDLFAGSGALGLEALSRGATRAMFVDRAPAAVAALRANIAALRADADISRADALRWLRGAAQDSARYSLIFLDPPYAKAANLGSALSEFLPAVMASARLVVSESDRRSPLELDIPITDERRYGDTLIRIYDGI